jgi:beta-glucosidase
VNLECGYIYQFLPNAIAQGLIPENTVDTILRPLLKTRFRLGLFDQPDKSPWADLGDEVVNNEAHKALAKEAAVKSIVLLQNKNNVLPLKRDSISSILVAGPTAADILALTGNYNGWSGDMVTFLEGIMRAVDAGTKVDYTLGCQMTTPGDYIGFWEAKMSDAVIVCLGNTRMLEGEEGDAMLNPNGGDRVDINLPQCQREYIRLMRENAPDKPIIAVVTGGSAIALQDVLESADAVLFAWYPGEQGGNALADILFGKVNPSGKLPVTFYKSVDDLPPFDDYSMKGRTYKYFEGEPLFPFGFGLSYTKFEYIGSAVPGGKLLEGSKVKSLLTIQNTGKYDGEEVVLAYISRGGKPMKKEGFYWPEKEKRLIGFSRVFLKAGETKTIPIEADLMDMYQWDPEKLNYFVAKGHYILHFEPTATGGFSMQFDFE